MRDTSEANRLRACLAAALLVVLAAGGCGGAGEGDDEARATAEAAVERSEGQADAAANTVPVANAGRDQNVSTGTLVTLHGTSSFGPEGAPLTYSWTLPTKPPGSTATLAGARTAKPTFSADRDGSYVARLVVGDGSLTSAADSVTVVASSGNSAPVANAGRDQIVAAGASVTLHGTSSSDADGDPLRYAWTLVSKPLESTALLAGARTARPTFVADKRGSYVARLVVGDGTLLSAPDRVTVEANTPPVAHAGRDQTVTPGTVATLHGTSSSDADGDALTFSWTLTAKPSGSAATLTGAQSARPTLTADKEGAYVARLVVADGLASSAPDAVTITAAAGGPGLGQQAYVKASNYGGRFGHSVALSGDTLVVGAYLESSAATGVNGNQANFDAGSSGAVYVFTRVNGSWSKQAYLKASNTGAGDNFGYSVAISGDTIVVGAPAEDSAATGMNGQQGANGATDSGAAYVFVRGGGVWSQQAYLKPSNTGAGDRFGHSVAVSGDSIVVGAYLEDSLARGVNGDQGDAFVGTNSGAAYVFARTAGVWAQQAYLKASNAYKDDSFGYSVAISGERIVIGAPTEGSAATGVNGNQASDGAPSSGAAYVFGRTNGLWTQRAYLKASNTDVTDLFGWSVALDGDTVVVGAHFEDSGATGINGNESDRSAGLAGAAYIFVRAGGAWVQQAYVKASNTQAGDVFGESVAVSGELVVVGARWEDSSATGVNGNQSDNSFRSAGAAYVYRRANGVWAQVAYVKASNTGSEDPSFGDEFGAGVAVSGNTVVIGAHHEGSSATDVDGNQADNSAIGSGAAYVFTLR